MKIMITGMPFAGHAGPLRPLVHGLVERGHKVRVHTGRRYADAFRAAGATVVPWQAAADFDEHDLPATFPRLGSGTGPRQMLANLREVFVGTAAGQAQDLVAAHAQEPWDVLLADSTSFGAGLAAELTRTPWASISLVPLVLPSRDLPPGGLGLLPGRGRLGRARDAAFRVASSTVLSAALGRSYARARREAGLEGRGPGVARAPFSPSLLLATSVPELELPRTDLPAHVHFVGRMDAPPPASSGLPAWWGDVLAGDRPVVHVTQGTLNAEPSDLLLPTLEALADEPVLVVATTGRRGRLDLPGPVPDNARVTDLLPYAELLPRTTAMVTNGGWGGVTAALAHGVPLVVAGGDIDKPEIAARVGWSGAGIDLRTGRPTPEQVRAAVRRVLSEPDHAEAARRVARSFAEHDGPREVADLLQRLVTSGGPVPRTTADPWVARLAVATA
jgi:UDP:flavonoid glycosyltransferase YjiC (YdhE family)